MKTNKNKQEKGRLFGGASILASILCLRVFAYMSVQNRAH